MSESSLEPPCESSSREETRTTGGGSIGSRTSTTTGVESVRRPSSVATNGGSVMRPTGEIAMSAVPSVMALVRPAPSCSSRDVVRQRRSWIPGPRGGSSVGAVWPGARLAAVSVSGRHAVAVSGPCAVIASCARSVKPISTRASPILAAWWWLRAVRLLLLALHLALLALGAAQQLLGLSLREGRLRLGLHRGGRFRRVRRAAATTPASPSFLLHQRELVVPLRVGFVRALDQHLLVTGERLIELGLCGVLRRREPAHEVRVPGVEASAKAHLRIRSLRRAIKDLC